MSPEVRIGSGVYKGRKISSSTSGYRPTSGIVKKSLFDILAGEIEESRFLDLFAGCGSVGLEALSRGAKQVCFVDNNIPRINVIKKNLERLQISKEAAEVIAMDYDAALDLLRKHSERFDYVYVDPPYEKMTTNRILGDIATSKVLDEDGIIIFELTKREIRKAAESIPKVLYPVRERVLGSTALLFIRWRRECPRINNENNK